MNSILLIIAAVITGAAAATEQNADGVQLARQLANENTRAAAIADIRSGGAPKIRALLSWTTHPPEGLDIVEKHDFYVGLADAFGELKTTAAIPFLIREISLERPFGGKPNVWLKETRVVGNNFPAAAALTRIGPPAASALIRAYWGCMTDEDRLIALFAIARIAAAPNNRTAEERNFLRSALAELDLERYWAENGLKQFGDTER